MNNFDLKKYLVENKLTEDVTSSDLEYLQGLNTNYTNDELIQFVEHPIFQEYKKDMPMDEENEGNWENSLDEFFMDADIPSASDLPENKTSMKMKKSELKEMIRQDILAELRADAQYEDPEGYDFLAEEDMEEDLDEMLARYSEEGVDPYLAEAEEDEVATDIEVDAEEETTDGGEEKTANDSIVVDKKIVSLSSLPSETRKILDSLETLRAQAEEFGDQKFITQVGNTITFFTRDFVVAGDAPNPSGIEESAFPMWNKIK